MSSEIAKEKTELRKWLLEEKSFLSDLKGSHRIRVINSDHIQHK
jgi:hypothetical protein